MEDNLYHKASDSRGLPGPPDQCWLRALFQREWVLGLGAVGLLTGVWLADPAGLITNAREAAFETVAWLLPRQGSSGQVRVVDIDRESLAQLGAWPWRRSDIARLIDAIAAEKPVAIALDILLSGEDRKGPAALARELREVSGRPEGLEGFQDDDQVLANAVANAGNVALGIVLDDLGQDPPPPTTPFAVEGDPAGTQPRVSAGLLGPHEPIAAGAAGFGVLSFQEGPLGRVASAPVFTVAAGEVFPSLAVEAVRVRERAELLVLRSNPRRVVIGSVEVPADGRADMRVYTSRPQTWSARTVPAWTLMSAGARPAGTLEGKVVLVGSSAPEAGAFLPMAGTALAPTVQIQAEAVEQILTGAFLLRPERIGLLEVPAMLLLGALSVALAVLLPPGAAALSVVVLLGSWLATVAGAFLSHRLLIDPNGVLATVLTGGNIAALLVFTRTRALKAAILQKFERYVPPEVVERLVREPGRLRLDGELREVTALVTDLEGFTRMTESSDPRSLVEVLDLYFDGVTEIVVEHRGMVDKIVGDAVLAFFNIPTPLTNHSNAAVDCAEAIVAWTETFRQGIGPSSMGFGRTRCGLESGMAIVGDVGGRRRLDYTAYGVVVNKAARFQEANKALGSAICIGPVAAKMLQPGRTLRPLGRIHVRGLEERCEVFEPWPGGSPPPDIRHRYEVAVDLAESNPGQARQLIVELAARVPHDRVVQAWLQRLA